MTEQHVFEDRLGEGVNVAELIDRAANAYGLNGDISYEPISVGYEDFNVVIGSSSGKSILKVFSVERTVDESSRIKEVLLAALAAGVSQPALLKAGGQGSELFVDRETGLSMVLMEFIEGSTFYQASVPTDAQLARIAEEVVKLHCSPYRPSKLFDGWAVPNIRWLYDQTKDRLDEYEPTIRTIIEAYEAIDLDRLTTCFVHGDVIKSNIIMRDAQPFIIDFSCANQYPKIQELAVIAANLLATPEPSEPFEHRIVRIESVYLQAGGTLDDYERSALRPYAHAAVACELMGSIYDEDATVDESLYWRQLAVSSLKEINLNNI